MATKAEIRDRAASDLGIAVLEQGLQDKDKVRIESAYDETYDELKELGLATWSSIGEVPNMLVRHVVNLVAYNCIGTYSIPVARYDRLILEVGENGEKAKSKIRELISEKYESRHSPKDY